MALSLSKGCWARLPIVSFSIHLPTMQFTKAGNVLYYGFSRYPYASPIIDKEKLLFFPNQFKGVLLLFSFLSLKFTQNSLHYLDFLLCSNHHVKLFLGCVRQTRAESKAPGGIPLFSAQKFLLLIF